MTALSPGLSVSPAELSHAGGDDTRELSVRLVSGEEAAWSEFHARTFDRLLRYLIAAAHGNEEAARDAVQIAYVKCVRHVRRFDSEEAMWGWLKQIARGSLIDLARGRSRYAAFLERYARASSNQQREDDARTELAELLTASLDRLAPSDRALLEARYTRKEHLTQIATTAGTSRKAVESRLARIRARLRGWLTSKHHER